MDDADWHHTPRPKKCVDQLDTNDIDEIIAIKLEIAFHEYREEHKDWLKYHKGSTSFGKGFVWCLNFAANEYIKYRIKGEYNPKRADPPYKAMSLEEKLAFVGIKKMKCPGGIYTRQYYFKEEAKEYIKNIMEHEIMHKAKIIWNKNGGKPAFRLNGLDFIEQIAIKKNKLKY